MRNLKTEPVAPKVTGEEPAEAVAHKGVPGCGAATWYTAISSN